MLLANGLETQALFEAVEQKKDERPGVLSEASLPSGQICEHRRNRSSKSATLIDIRSN
jgi:hypothetical protein